MLEISSFSDFMHRNTIKHEWRQCVTETMTELGEQQHQLTVNNESPFVFYCTIWYVWIFCATRQVFSIVIYHWNECQNAQWLIACLGKLWKWVKNDFRISLKNEIKSGDFVSFCAVCAEIKLLSMWIYEALQSTSTLSAVVSDDLTEIHRTADLICMEICFYRRSHNCLFVDSSIQAA